MISLVSDSKRKEIAHAMAAARKAPAPVAQAAERYPVRNARAFSQGAVIDRLSNDWRVSSLSGNLEMRADIRELRRRARALFRDDPYVTHAVREFSANIVGADGIRLDPKSPSPDAAQSGKAGATLLKAWKDWGHKEYASADERQSWIELQCSIVESLIVDGEVFVRHHAGHPNDYAYAIELVDPDLLDETFNRAKDANGNEIVMGVEIDPVFGAPIAYHFWTRHPSEPGSRTRVRVPASEIIHWFKAKRAKQARGVSWLTPIIFRLKMLGAYEDAEVTAARIAASKMGFFEIHGEDMGAYEPPAPGEQVTMDITPGSMEQLPPGYQFKSWDPQHPSAQFEKFIKAMLRGIASGLGMAYTTLTGDLEAVNYSSIRAGLLPEREMWKGMQKAMAENVHRLVFKRWFACAILTAKLVLPSSSFDRWTDVQWRGRGWKWVDPYNEIRTAEMQIAIGVYSRTRMCADLGLDFEEVIVELAHENKLSLEHDVYIDGIASKTDTPQPVEGMMEQPAPDGSNEPGADDLNKPDGTAKPKLSAAPKTPSNTKPQLQKVS